MPRMIPLLDFRCACGYTEPVGVAVRSGIIITGSITVICPECGHIVKHDGVNAMLPVGFRGARHNPADKRLEQT